MFIDTKAIYFKTGKNRNRFKLATKKRSYYLCSPHRSTTKII